MPVEARSVGYTYLPGTPSSREVLRGVDLRVEDGECLALVGPTGSGKTTLLKHLNGLLRPAFGQVLVDGVDIWARRSAPRWVRQKVGLLFQYPEDQLFAETVAADIAFGPRNLGLSPAEVEERVHEALELVGLEPGLLGRSPFQLSGGQMRRAALAGVLALRPSVLVLDEPTAGLDPQGRREILDHIRLLNRERGLGVVLVSHNMDEVARLADRIAVLDGGRIALTGPPREVFAQGDYLTRLGLDVPEAVRLGNLLRGRGWGVRPDLLTPDEAVEEILRCLAR